jgi:hypothetical protein
VDLGDDKDHRTNLHEWSFTIDGPAAPRDRVDGGPARDRAKVDKGTDTVRKVEASG